MGFRRLLGIIIAFLSFLSLYAQDVIPQPKEYQQFGEKRFVVRKIQYKETSFANSEEYRIEAKRGKVTIEGNRIWALQTLSQLQDERQRIPDVTIHDWPDYPFRGFMHDTGRNFQPLEMLKETIDLMGFYKINVFHWHLTDYPAWRIECRAYPQLNDPQYQRPGRDPGAFYTYDEIRELMAYAKDRGVMVMPEIDMPGHSTYFKNAFGFTMDSAEGRKVLERCLGEFFSEIPETLCPYFHIGSDEVYISDPKGFMEWAEALVRRYGRVPVVWDPGLPASDQVVRQIWNTAAGSNAAAADKGGKYLDSFMGYLNYYDPNWFTNHVFLHTPAAQMVPDTQRALGGILCLWNDVRVDDKANIALHNGMINGMMAYSERFWNGGALANPLEALAAFEKKMTAHRDRYHQGKMVWEANSHIQWEIQVNHDTTIGANGGAVDLDALCAEHAIAVAEGSIAVARTLIPSKSDTVIEAWIGFDTPARSNRNGVGIGEQGRWEGDAKVFVNGVEITPAAEWNEPGKYDYRFNTWGKPQEEEPFTNEQLYWMRPAVRIALKKGENVVEVVIPKLYEGLRWSFAFIPH